MISLQNKILRPYMFFIVIIPLSIMAIFTISMQYFSDMQAQRGLKIVYKNLQESFAIENTNLPPIAKLYRAKNFAIGTELLLFTPRGRLAKFGYLSETTIEEAVASMAFSELSQRKDGEIISFSHKEKNYYAMKTQARLNTRPVVAVYISYADFFHPFIASVNKLFMAISLIIIIIALFISRKVTISLVKPIKSMVKDVEDIMPNTSTIITSTTDIVELNYLSQKINSMGKKIYEYNQEQKSFLHNSSHELRTPLMNIQGYVEGIEQNIFADNNYATNIIKEETKRLSVLVDELLTLSRMDTFEQQREFSLMSLQKILQEQMHPLHGYALKNNKEINIEVLSDAEVLLNEEMFYQAVSNVISNAIRFAQKTITVRLIKTSSEAIVEIADDGNGIAAKDLPYIFDKFYRGEKGNFGLGLAISKSAMQSMGGSIEAKNATAASGGAVFTLNFPLLNANY